MPVVEESYNTDRTHLSLEFSKKQANKTSEQSKLRKTEENYKLIESKKKVEKNMQISFKNFLYDTRLNHPSRIENKSNRTEFEGLDDVCEKLEEYDDVERSVSTITVTTKSGIKKRIVTRYNNGEWSYSQVTEGSPNTPVDIIIAIHGNQDQSGNSITYSVVDLPKGEDEKFPNKCTEKQWTIPKDQDENNTICQPRPAQNLTREDAVAEIIKIINSKGLQ